MKYLKRFNEELRAATYTSASNKLKQIGHERRAGVMGKWASEVNDREKEDLRLAELDRWSKNGTFEMGIYQDKYVSDPRTGITTHDHKLIMSGRFFIKVTYDGYQFFDMYSDWNGKYNFQMFLNLELGIMPADTETLELFKLQKFDTYMDAIWANWIAIKLCDAGERSINPRGDISFEPIDRDQAYFSNRKEAIRFKNLLSDSLINKTSLSGVGKSVEDTFISIWKTQDDESNEEVVNDIIPGDIMERIARTIKRSTINTIYRD